MNKDFRLNVSYFTHPKTKKIKRRHGLEGVISHLKLLAFAATHRPKGVLYDMKSDDILDASEWPGDTEFVQSLIEFGLLDQTPKWLEIHDWPDHNGYAMHAEDREKKARDAANKRWGISK